MALAWNRDSVSVVVLPDESLFPTLAPVIEEWSREGLLDRFFLVLPSKVVSKEYEAPVIQASMWMEQNGEYGLHQLDAFEQLAQHEFKLVRFIVLQILQNDSKLNQEQSDSLIRISNAVLKSLPLTNARLSESEQVTQFLKINLVVAPTEVHGRSKSAPFDEFWDMQIIASPEDRSTPWTADAMVRNDQRFLRFAMMHLASAGGLWNGLGISPFELVSKEKARLGQKWISRVFVNAILTDGLARRVSAQALNEIANATKDIFDTRIAITVPGTAVIPPDQVDQYVTWMVSEVFRLDNGVLSFRQPAVPQLPGKLNFLEWEQISHFLQFSWDKIKVIPWWIYIWFRRKIGKKLTQTFQTDEGLAQVGISQEDTMDLRDRRLVDTLLHVIAQSKIASKAMTGTDGNRVTRPNARLWTDLRRIVFGMLDGSDLSEFGIQETDGRVPVFANTSQVVSDPSDTFKLPSELQTPLNMKELSWSNINRVPEVELRIKNLLENLQAERTKLETDLAGLDSQLSSYSDLRGVQS